MSKVWLITGSARGIGRQVAEAALSAGEHVVATARKPERLHELVERYGDRVRTLQQDVRDPSAAATAVQTAVDAFGRIDVVLHAARSAEPAVGRLRGGHLRSPCRDQPLWFCLRDAGGVTHSAPAVPWTCNPDSDFSGRQSR